MIWCNRPPTSWGPESSIFPLSMLHQEVVQTPRSRCGVVVLAMLLLVAIGIGRHRGGCHNWKRKVSLQNSYTFGRLHSFRNSGLAVFLWTKVQAILNFHTYLLSKTVSLDSLLASPPPLPLFFQGQGQGLMLNVQLAGVACMVMDVRKPLLHGLDTLRGLLTDEAPRQFGNEAFILGEGWYDGMWRTQFLSCWNMMKFIQI